MASLDTLPCEILLQIFNDNSPQDLCCLSYTCKRLGSIAGACFWKDIELHERGYHKSSAELNEPLPYKSPNRFYHNTKRNGWRSGINKRAEKLFTLLQTLHARDEERLKELAGRVKCLCTVIEAFWHPGESLVEDSVSVWNLLPYFTNLEYLELHGNQWEDLPEIRAAPLSKLRFAKLFGYIPRPVATYVLRSEKTLERLELGMLDQPVSRDAGIAVEDDMNRGRRQISSGGAVPRPLGDFFPNTSTSFPRLTHLYLCQPSNSWGDYFNQSNSWSVSAEKSSLEAWRKLLLASSRTLETLVLEQRPAAGEEDNEGFSEEEFLNTGATGFGDRALVETLGRTIIDKDALPKLSQVYLYGLVARPRARGRPPHETPADWLLHGLEGRGVTCEARRGKWCLFDQDSGETNWAKWAGDGNYNVHDCYMGIRWYTLLAEV
ncbi:hypothetical protein F53441_11781 [Fusarium austroafricanum]|uniref:F-box domain-containing protein n=1 Tax=Fusarium austroafricanum TaxID=2364996 RepID=A0A8H4NRC2_9HYPO|nr:hypothetical protein F53441_11781 [Fusarium austroafricanum]